MCTSRFPENISRFRTRTSAPTRIASLRIASNKCSIPGRLPPVSNFSSTSSLSATHATTEPIPFYQKHKPPVALPPSAFRPLPSALKRQHPLHLILAADDQRRSLVHRLRLDVQNAPLAICRHASSLFGHECERIRLVKQPQFPLWRFRCCRIQENPASYQRPMKIRHQ